MPEPVRGIDPRGPRFAAALTSLLLLADLFLALTGAATAALALLLAVALLFVWGVVSPPTAPWGVLFRVAVRPRLGAPAELEDPRPPRFAQGVGLAVTALGATAGLLGVEWAVGVAAAVAFAAAFLNAAFGVCLGCLAYLALQRAGAVGRRHAA